MDVVYVLGKGSKWQDNELRYSLRSVEKFLKGYDQVVVVGERPSWLKNVVHIPFANARSHVFKQQNIYDKILQACNADFVSNDFLFFNDDFFLLQAIQADAIPYYYKGDLVGALAGRDAEDSYGLSMSHTIELLKSLELPTLNFDGHAPIIYNKELFKAALKDIWWSRHHGYVVKSLYCNLCRITGTYLKDCKITQPYKMPELLEKIAGRSFFSCGDRGLQGDLKKYLEQTYPQKSTYET